MSDERPSTAPLDLDALPGFTADLRFAAAFTAGAQKPDVLMRGMVAGPAGRTVSLDQVYSLCRQLFERFFVATLEARYPGFTHALQAKLAGEAPDTPRVILPGQNGKPQVCVRCLTDPSDCLVHGARR
jgi:hypothetical protein